MAEQVLPRSKGGWGERETCGIGGRNGQTMYAHVHKLIKKDKTSSCYLYIEYIKS
jgi:hypothetical protein